MFRRQPTHARSPQEREVRYAIWVFVVTVITILIAFALTIRNAGDSEQQDALVQQVQARAETGLVDVEPGMVIDIADAVCDDLDAGNDTQPYLDQVTAMLTDVYGQESDGTRADVELIADSAADLLCPGTEVA